ncbi:hypothetical protein K1719_012258 [Acacia pycnantha]|nr:hypothetical protein K1719_012258 [Acacia pycnantha]
MAPVSTFKAFAVLLAVALFSAAASAQDSNMSPSPAPAPELAMSCFAELKVEICGIHVFITFSILISLLFEVLSIAILKDPAVILVTPGPYGLIFASFCDRHTHGCYTTCNKKCLALRHTLSEEARHEGEAPTIDQLPPTSPTMTMGMDMTREEEEHELREMTLLTLKKTHNMERRHLLMWMVVLSGTGGERTRPGCERTHLWN